MWGSATLATEVSSTSMKVPSITEIAMSTGLERGTPLGRGVRGGGGRRVLVCHALDGSGAARHYKRESDDGSGPGGDIRAAAGPLLDLSGRAAAPPLPAARIAGWWCSAASAYGGLPWYYWHYHISTDDAYITARIAPMSARVPGIVVEVLVNDNQDVKADQVLMRLDPRDYEVAVAQARAAVASAKGDLRERGGRACR